MISQIAYLIIHARARQPTRREEKRSFSHSQRSAHVRGKKFDSRNGNSDKKAGTDESVGSAKTSKNSM